jgi:hypothetical protein
MFDIISDFNTLKYGCGGKKLVSSLRGTFKITPVSG